MQFTTQAAPKMLHYNSEPLSFDSAFQSSEMAVGGFSMFGPGELDQFRPRGRRTNMSSANSSTSDEVEYPDPVSMSSARTSHESPSGIPPSTQSASTFSVDTPGCSVLQLATNQSMRIADWQPFLDADGSPTVSARSISGAGIVSYASRPNANDPYMGDYISPTSFQSSPQSIDFYNWVNSADFATGLSPFDLDSLASPVSQSYEMVADVSEDGAGDADLAIYGGLDSMKNWQQQSPQQLQTSEATGATAGESLRSNKCIQAGLGQQTLQTIPPTMQQRKKRAPACRPSERSHGKIKLRSASRVSKNFQNRPIETSQRQKARNLHNTVEKQYRNRLNLKFEALMNILPETMCSPTGTSALGGDSDGASQTVDLGERRLRKAQVLEYATGYIRSLERGRDDLERQKEALLGYMSQLREMYAKGDSGFSSGENGSYIFKQGSGDGAG